jgi:alpha-L-rhamnosidase
LKKTTLALKAIAALCLTTRLLLAADPTPDYAAEVGELRCEFRVNPLAIDAAKPGLSWKLETGNRKPERGIRQTAYQILVASSADLLKNDTGDLWDSGKVVSDQSAHVDYQGKPLATGVLCHWKVRVWEEKFEGGNRKPEKEAVTAWSKPAFWRMGILKPADPAAPSGWVGKWISFPGEDLNLSPWMRKSFDLPAVPKHAFVTVNIAGYAELYINGQKVGTDVLTPAVSDNTKQVFYNTYDVTSLLKLGRNTIGLWLGRGMATRKDTAVHHMTPAVPYMRAQIEAEIDGKHWTLGTDAGWKTSPSSYQRSGGTHHNDFGGERVDPSAHIANWSSPDFDDKDWRNAVEVEAPKCEAVAQQAPLNRIGKEIPAVAVNDLGGGRYEIDFGTALTGWMRLKMPVWNTDPEATAPPEGPANLKILKATYASRDGAGSADVTAKVAALAKDDALNFEVAPGALGGDPVPNHAKDLIVDYELHGNRRSTRAADFSPLTIPEQPKCAVVRMTFADKKNYGVKIGFGGKPDPRPDGSYQHFNQVSEFVSTGKPGEVFEHKFNYAGFRYVLVEGLPVAPKKEDAVAMLVESDLEPTGAFECSNDLFNRISRVNQWTQRSLNLGGYFVDCPHRERLGYGDGQVATEGFMTSFGSYGFYRKWLMDWRLRQGADGYMPHVAPFGYGGGGPGWPGLLSAITWRHYLYYGDKRVLEENYDAIRRFVDNLESRSKDGVMRAYGGAWDFIGDWVPPERGMDTNNWPGRPAAEFFNNCYRIQQLEILRNIAIALGKTDEVERCDARLATARAAVHAAFFDKATGNYGIDEQAYYIMPLLTGVTPEADRPALLQKLEKNILEKNNGHLDSGMLGTYFMMEHLRAIGRNDLVFTMFNQTAYPGWGYMVEQGATTLWEQWNGFWSNIHSCFTSPDNWFYQGLAGIQTDPAAPGFKNTIIKPAIVGDVTWVNSHHISPYGRIVSNWKREGEKLTMDVTVPPNATATVFVPAKDAASVTESGKPAGEAKSVKFLRMENNAAVYAVGSGNYQFQSQL